MKRISYISILILLFLSGCASTPSKDLKAGKVDVQYTRSFPDGSRLKSNPEEVMIISRSTMGKSVAAQIGINVMMVALGSGIGVSPATKNDLKGYAITDVDDRSNIKNPIPTEFVSDIDEMIKESVGNSAKWQSRVYQNPVLIGGGRAKLIYESLLGDDDLYKFKLDLLVYKKKESSSFFGKQYESVDCSSESESPLELTVWSENDYLKVNEEFSSLLEKCETKVMSQLGRLLAN